MRRLNIILSVLMTVMLLASCSGSSSTKLGELCDVYAEIAENKAAWMEAFQAVYSADKDSQQALQAKAEAIAEEAKTKNEALAAKAKEIGEQLLNTDIPCEAGSGLSYTVEKGIFTTVQTTPEMANIVISATPNGAVDGKPYVLMLDDKGDVVARTIGSYLNGNLIVNFRITTNKGPEPVRNYGQIRSLKFVSETEYKTGNPAETVFEQPAETASIVQEKEENSEPEAAFTGGETASSESVTVQGVTISKGAPLAETLRKFKKITWDYNADFGVTATVGNVWFTIDESDLTQKGQDIINAIPSDMENNISFSVDYIKPSAKINQFESN